MLFLLILIGLSPGVNSRDLSSASLRLQLSSGEVEARKQKALETNFLIQIDPEGTRQTTYEEWIVSQGTPRPFSTNLAKASAPMRADSKICVLVNSDLFPSIETSIDQYVTDLVAEGYTVEVHTISGGTPQELRTFLQSLYALGMEGCLFVGDLPIAWYEVSCSWDPPQDEEFPCDLYYMDLDGNFYDNDENGKFDYHDGNQNPEIYVGRLTASPLIFNGATEANLTNNYFRKNHLYRTGELITNNRALAFIDDDWMYDGDNINNGLEYIYCQSILINDSATTNSTVYENELMADYEYIHVAVHSNYAGHFFSAPGGGGTTYYYEICTIDPTAIFYNLFACSNSRYVDPNYMGGWYIFTDSYGLAATGATKTGSMLNFDIFYYPMGNGATIGEAFYIWFDEMANWGFDNYSICWFYGNTLLGDPTLKPRDRRPVELIAMELPYCLKGILYSIYLDADGGGAPPYSWNILSGQLPDGLLLNQSTGQISGRPTESGIFNFTVSAEDPCSPIFADTMEYSVDIVGICGDANNSGLIEMDDVLDIIDYLYNDGSALCPVAAGDMDMFNGVNNNDAYYLYEHVAHTAVFPRCPPFAESIPSAPENILELTNTTVRPGDDRCIVKFWLNSAVPAKALSIPFKYSCATSTVNCDSITFAGSSFAHYVHKYGKIDAVNQKGIIGLVNTGETAPSGNPAKIATAWFTVEPAMEEQLIIIESDSFGPNNAVIVSPAPQYPYIPSISIIPGFSFLCGDANNDDVINILDVVFLINYIYKNGPDPAIPESIDVNNDENANILDIVFLINFLYKNGPYPACD